MSETLGGRFINAKRALFDRFYEKMNPCQREAVYTLNGPLLVLAGAGSGKTTVLVNRIAHMIKFGNAYASEEIPEGLSEKEVLTLESALTAELTHEEIGQILSEYAVDQVSPWSILAITFTNKAANEMKTRIATVLNDEELSSKVWAATFHSTCVRLLRRYGDAIGYARDFSIYDEDDKKRLITAVEKELGIDEKMFPPKSVITAISRAKDALMTPADFEREAGCDFRLSKISAIYFRYQEKLREANALDFDDLIMQTVRLLKEAPDVREHLEHLFRYVSVDEFQDTNKAQFELTKLLTGYYHNVMVVGDDDQSIYRFRGATIENILGFDQAFERCKVVKLEQNYRSTQTILSAANAVIRCNTARKGKELWTNRGDGEKIRVKKLQNQNEEAKYIINKIQDAVRNEGRRYSDFAVLYRMNSQSNNLENYFVKTGIPFRLLGGVRFYERKEIKDLLAYLAVLNNPSDSIRLRRIINEPKRKIGETTVDAVMQLAESEGRSPFEIMEYASDYVALAKSAQRLSEFVLMIREMRAYAETAASLGDLINYVYVRSGYQEMLKGLGDEGLERKINVGELVNNAVTYEQEADEASLEGFLESVALVSDVDSYDNAADAVVLMTVHSAKGLEFPVVFLPGFEDGIFPTSQASLDPEELEEERRLAYVAITRAKDRLFCIHVRERMIFGKTQFNPRSRFIDEMPEELLDFGYLPNNDSETSEHPFARQKKKPTLSAEFSRKVEPAPHIAPRNADLTFQAGDRVLHAAFGEGNILSVQKMGPDLLLEIMFDNVGTKKLMATFAKLKKI